MRHLVRCRAVYAELQVGFIPAGGTSAAATRGCNARSATVGTAYVRKGRPRGSARDQSPRAGRTCKRHGMIICMSMLKCNGLVTFSRKDKHNALTRLPSLIPAVDYSVQINTGVLTEPRIQAHPAGRGPCAHLVPQLLHPTTARFSPFVRHGLNRQAQQATSTATHTRQFRHTRA